MSGPSRKSLLKGIKEKLSSQTFPWDITLADTWHIERFKDHGVSFSDRANVLVGVSTIEIALRDAIIAKLSYSEPAFLNSLFSVNEGGPLSSFSSKIKIGLAIGIYEKMFFEDLDVIRQIRNYFAHSVEYLDFKDAALVSAVEALHAPKAKLQTFALMRVSEDDHKGKFIETGKWAMMELAFRSKDSSQTILDREYFNAET